MERRCVTEKKAAKDWKVDLRQHLVAGLTHFPILLLRLIHHNPRLKLYYDMIGNKQASLTNSDFSVLLGKPLGQVEKIWSRAPLLFDLEER